MFDKCHGCGEHIRKGNRNKVVVYWKPLSMPVWFRYFCTRHNCSQNYTIDWFKYKSFETQSWTSA